MRVPWFVWEHDDHSGLEIGPRYKKPYRGFEDRVDAIVTMRGGSHGLTDEQRQQAEYIARAVTNHDSLVAACVDVLMFINGDYEAKSFDAIQILLCEAIAKG